MPWWLRLHVRNNGFSWQATSSVPSRRVTRKAGHGPRQAMRALAAVVEPILMARGKRSAEGAAIVTQNTAGYALPGSPDGYRPLNARAARQATQGPANRPQCPSRRITCRKDGRPARGRLWHERRPQAPGPPSATMPPEASRPAEAALHVKPGGAQSLPWRIASGCGLVNGVRVGRAP